ncbi:hypothetical protein [Cellulophaga sp. Hel_I_12]|uniref:hypothetical protein n=1 Tax=Cellulophaga sp. Hel_I_12 TaxID=1249972 RepID=UPI000646856E|nr:hypothetical protein [Cellulophaga sp. Hel_I_12]
MKNKAYLKFILVLLLGMSWFQGQAQTLHELVLTVDTTMPNSEGNNSFSAGNNTTIENSSLNRFTIWAEVGDSVQWTAKAAGDSKVPVKIIGVSYMGGPRIFSSNTLTGGGNTIKATIIRGGKEDYVYTLQYTLGSDTKVYAVTALIKTKK